MTSIRKPDGYSTVSAYLVVDDAEATIRFLEGVFGATTQRRVPAEGGKLIHAEVRFDDSMIMVRDGVPAFPTTAAHVHVYVDDAMAAYQRALEAGARSLQTPAQRAPGDDVRGGVIDPWGTTWWIAEAVR